jgi:pyruvate dehydrogenase (quinone)
VCPSDEEIAALAAILNQSKNITILGGAGCAGAHAELIALAGTLNAPIVHPMRGKEFIEYDNPFDVGMTGLLGFSSGDHAIINADLLLMIGTDFPYQQFFPSDATIVQIDVRGEQLGRRTKVDTDDSAIYRPGCFCLYSALLRSSFSTCCCDQWLLSMAFT